MTTLSGDDITRRAAMSDSQDGCKVQHVRPLSTQIAKCVLFVKITLEDISRHPGIIFDTHLNTPANMS